MLNSKKKKKKKKKKKILQAVHEGSGNTLESRALAGHFGQDKTESKLLDRFWWPGIRGDVRKFVKNMRTVPESCNPFHQNST